MKKICFCLWLGFLSWGAQAANLAFSDIKVESRSTVRYRCKAGQSLNVTYLQAANGQSFARVPVQGKPMIFVNVVSASGAKYASDQYVWWTKGGQADLWNEINDRRLFEDCVEQKK